MIDSSMLSELASLGLTAPQYQAVLSLLSRLEANYEKQMSQDILETKRRQWRDNKRTLRGQNASPPPKEKNQTPLPPVANATALVWQDCVPLLTSLGLQERIARSNLGRWLKAHTPEAVRAAVEAAVGAGTGDPIPYITKTLKAGINNVVPLSFRPEPKRISNEEWKRMKEQGNEACGKKS